MGQIPNHNGADCVRGVSDGFHIVQSASAIVGMGEHHHGNSLVDVIQNRLRVWRAQLVVLAKGLNQSLRHIEVGREIAAVG